MWQKGLGPAELKASLGMSFAMRWAGEGPSGSVAGILRSPRRVGGWLQERSLVADCTRDKFHAQDAFILQKGISDMAQI